MKRSEIICRLIESAAMEDRFGASSEGDMLRTAAAMLLEQEIEHHRKTMQEYLERLNDGVQLR
jgi:hypothetical protein